MSRRRLLALGGLAGPAAFIGAWAAGSAVADGYSAVDDAISRLAATGAATQPLMTAGFVAFGVGVPALAVPLRRWAGTGAAAAAVTTGLATLGVAATPLDSGVDTLHGAFAFTGYASLAAVPLLAARPLRRAGRPRWARWSAAAGVATVLLLTGTLLPGANGLFQRAGLTVGDVWLMAAAAHLLRSGARAPR